jgi:hypothetical protein
MTVTVPATVAVALVMAVQGHMAHDQTIYMNVG